MLDNNEFNRIHRPLASEKIIPVSELNRHLDNFTLQCKLEKRQGRSQSVIHEYQMALCLYSQMGVYSPIFNCPLSYFYWYKRGLYCTGYPRELTKTTFAQFLFQSGCPIEPQLGVFIAPAIIIPSEIDGTACAVQVHPHVIKLYDALVVLVRHFSAHKALYSTQLIEQFKIKYEVASCFLEQSPADMGITVLDDNIIYAMADGFHILSQANWPLFFETFPMRDLNWQPIVNFKLSLDPPTCALFSCYRRSLVDQSKKTALSYGNKENLSGLFFQFAEGAMQIVYDKKCKCFTQHSYEKRAVGAYHKFIGADPFSETTPPAFVVKLLFSLTGGAPNVLDALAKIAAHIFMTENLARHISVLHCESLGNIAILLQLLAKEHERIFPLADLCKSEKLFALIEAKANDAYYNISISNKACTAVMAGKLEALTHGKARTAADRLVGRKRFCNSMHLIHLTDSDAEIETLSQLCSIEPIYLCNAPALTEEYCSLVQTDGIDRQWLRTDFVLYGLKLLSDENGLKAERRERASATAFELFLSEYCVVDSAAYCVASELFQAYEKDCSARKIIPMRFIDFRKSLQKRGFDYGRKHHTRQHNCNYFEGIRPNDTMPPLAPSAAAEAPLSYEEFERYLVALRPKYQKTE